MPNEKALGAVPPALVDIQAAPATPVSIPGIPEAIARASTVVEHQNIAEYFSRKAADYDAEAALCEWMLAAYATGSGAYPATFIDHCRQLRTSFSAVVLEARALAHAHRQLAETTGKLPPPVMKNSRKPRTST